MQNFGLIRRGAGTAVLEPTKVPALPDDYVLVKTKAVALNPTDWTTIDAVGNDGTIVGCDYAGNDANPENGAFARYVAVKVDLQMHIPDGVSFEAASTAGCGIGSAGYGLYYVLGLKWPGSDTKETGETILIYGGSTATGALAIQLAKLSGYNVVTTCSPRNFDYVKILGADSVFDYRAPDVGKKIFEATGGSINKVFDTVNKTDSAAICAAAFGPQGGTYCNLLGEDCPRSDVKSVFFLGYDMSGEAYIFEGDSYPARPEALEFGRKWYRVAEQLWAEGRWQNHREKVGEKGLLGVLDGLEMMREGLVSGEKLVYRVDETEWPTSS